ncbi:hypothetical protein [Streptomyces sp. MNU89]|uniref:hypothetical protein n=1 Tax=Streptomyces sp. MNU89 TaxID=2560025 RepID=UPI001E3513F9|nr:hypothetical protein [Streptomyces sp. MNU89]MCC9740969.1 hypothetical protein [Streptomyces sp. MNU89]
MTADGWTQAGRNPLGPGLLLPLGGPGDGAWITERAACAVLTRAAARVDGVRLGAVRIRLAVPEAAPEPAAGAHRAALQPEPLRIEADFSASARQPLPRTAGELRRALLAAATGRLGLPTAEIDLRVTDLLGEPARADRASDRAADRASDRAPDPSAARFADWRPGPAEAAGAGTPPPGADGAGPAPVSGSPHPSPGPMTHPSPGPVPVREPAAELADAVTAVPGVTRLAPVPEPPAGQTSRWLAQAVRIKDGDDPPSRYVRVQLATAEDHRALDVARAVRTAVAGAAEGDAPGPVTVTVLVTTVEPAGAPPA